MPGGVTQPAPGVFVVNGPTDTIAEGLIERMKAAISGKPIRYVTVSHFHSDHAGGVRPFWAEGATLLTTPGTRRYFEEYGRRPTTISPDRLSRLGADAPRRIDTVVSKRVITDGERVVEVINVGRPRHTDEALLVYLPREGIISTGRTWWGMATGRS